MHDACRVVSLVVSLVVSCRASCVSRQPGIGQYQILDVFVGDQEYGAGGGGQQHLDALRQRYVGSDNAPRHRRTLQA